MQKETTPAAPAAETVPTVVVHFPVQGRQLPADHGYALYSAITRQLPALHGAPWLGLELLSGVPWREGVIVLPTRGAQLRLRIPADRYAVVLPLAGKRLDIAGHPLHLGIPSARPLQPAPLLYARCVTIKKFTEPEPFLDAARRQLYALGINATLELPLDDQDRFRRRVIRIHGKHVVGFSLAAHDLSDDDSLKLQTAGIGGRRAMGCGMFNPIAQLCERERNL
ncbi:MAG TPA: type I-MYXAN CRISPR-associated protein Cas6/Cmx6 [Pyrinomonadaceae bacterium]|nr:type I-MYXAN CRISPR-associated protein Cas6/Cmx6 [Pyrinomonadaceae bacterium]